MLYKGGSPAHTFSARPDRSMPGFIPLEYRPVDVVSPMFELVMSEFRHPPQNLNSWPLVAEMNTLLRLDDIENNPKGFIVYVESRIFHLG